MRGAYKVRKMVGKVGKLIELAHCRVLRRALVLDKLIGLVSHSEHFSYFIVLPLLKNFVSLLLSSFYILFLHTFGSYSCSDVLVYRHCLCSQCLAAHKTQPSRTIRVYYRGYGDRGGL